VLFAQAPSPHAATRKEEPSLQRQHVGAHEVALVHDSPVFAVPRSCGWLGHWSLTCSARESNTALEDDEDEPEDPLPGSVGAGSPRMPLPGWPPVEPALHATSASTPSAAPRGAAKPTPNGRAKERVETEEEEEGCAMMYVRRHEQASYRPEHPGTTRDPAVIGRVTGRARRVERHGGATEILSRLSAYLGVA